MIENRISSTNPIDLEYLQSIGVYSCEEIEPLTVDELEQELIRFTNGDDDDNNTE